MKSGSLVECINNKKYEDRVKLETPYTVTEVVPKGTYLKMGDRSLFFTAEDGIFLEGVNSYVPDWKGNIPFPMKDFRELMPNVKGFVEELFELIELVPA